MKITILLMLSALIFSTLANAVSIEFPTLPAVSIGDLTTSVSEDGLTTHTEIEFSGPGLSPLFHLLPKVKEEGVVLKDFRLLSITNLGTAGVAEDKATAIYLECRQVEKVVVSSTSIFKGVLPG